jgi:hypothetical protein
MLKILIAIAPLALSTAAFAQPTHMSDAQYIAAARCQVLMSSASLGHQDTSEINALMNAQGGSRSNMAADRAQEAAAAAQQAVRHAGAYSKAALIAERDGSCKTLTGVATVSAAAGSSGTTRTN